jgi:hypothetical protein
MHPRLTTKSASSTIIIIMSRVTFATRPLKHAVSPHCSTLQKACLSTRPPLPNDPLNQPSLHDTHNSLLQEASCLTRSLYRTCMRCAKQLRQANEHDERDFLQRERETSKPSHAMLSSMYPVDRKDELESRSNYYLQYTRENFVGEADILDQVPWKRDYVNRYVYMLRKGEKDRKWLLNDMKFNDKYTEAFNNERVQDFERRALEYVDTVEREMYGVSNSGIAGMHGVATMQAGSMAFEKDGLLADSDENEDDGFFTDSDDEY